MILETERLILRKIKDLRVYGLLKEEWKKARPKVVKKVKEKIKLFP